MNIETKFSLGDIVYPIAEVTRKEWVMCSFCGGQEEEFRESLKNSCVTGRDGTEKRCPSCFGTGGSYRYFGRRWHCFGGRKVVEIEAKVTFDMECDRIEGYLLLDEEREAAYHHAVVNIFSSEAEALSECSTRNNRGGCC